jgi:glycine betaine/choline ABC-type transport system substrate-binding protein
MLALGASTLVLAGACSTGGGSTPSPAASTAAIPSAGTSVAPSAGSAAPASAAPASPVASAAANSIASQLVLGGPPECPQRPFCLIGLEKTYGLSFKSFVPLDAGGPLTVAALATNKIQVGLIFTSDPSIAVKGFVLLNDDRHLQASDNIAPVIRTAVLQAHPDLKGLLEAIMAKLTQDQLTALNKQVSVDKADPADVARAWLQQQGFVPSGGSGKGTVVVGSTNFYEQEILGELFAQQLEANGYTVVRKFRLGSREVVEPAIESGQIDVEAEYMATLLEYLDKGAGLASGDPAKTAATLTTYLSQRGLSLLQYAQATDQNGFAVTKQTAQQYGLVNISDLAKPAP